MSIAEARLPDPVLLRTFLVVAETRSFTAAARRLGTRQSTVSQQISRLEAHLRRVLFARDTHSVALTPAGTQLLPFARDVLGANLRLAQAATGRTMSGRVRLGVSEDFALSGLADVLAEFTQQHADVEVELDIGLSGLLHQRFDAGALDVIFAKQLRGDSRGRTAWRETLAWVGRDGSRPDPQRPLPLIVYPPPSITRLHAIEALEAAGRSWKVACTSSSVNGLRAAALAGLGYLPHSLRLLPAGLSAVSPEAGLPGLGDIAFVVLVRETAGESAAALAEVLLEGAARLAVLPSATGRVSPGMRGPGA